MIYLSNETKSKIAVGYYVANSKTCSYIPYSDIALTNFVF